MKKIMSMLLAVAMVVSVLPATIFAAGETCPVLDEHDGYNDHSKAHCVAHGVTYTQISTVAPECGQDGYTLYKCACGDYFMDDIIPMDDHYSENDPAEVVEPTCTSTGMVPVYTCDNCGDKFVLESDVEYYADYYEVEVSVAGVIAKLPHTFETEYPGNDCTASESVCDVCGAKDEDHEPEEEHVYVYNDPDYYEVVEAPTYHKDGVIKFYCTNEGCSQGKPVAIKALQPHTAGMTLVEAVEPDCENTGNIEYWKDEVCGKLYIETNEGLVEVTEEDVFLDYEHDWDEDPTIIAPTCTTYGFAHYMCPTCGATKGVTPETENDKVTVYDPLGHTKRICPNPDHAEEADPDCDDCNSYGHDHEEPTCLLDGKYTWYCSRCNEQQQEKDGKTGHEKVTINVPGTHKYGYSYTIVYCKHDYCDKAAVKTVTKTIGGQRVALDVTVEKDEETGDIYDMPEDAERHVIEVKSAKVATTNLKHFFTACDEVQAPTCTESGMAFWYCEGEDGCNTYYDQILDPLGHDYSDDSNDLDPTCTENAYEVCDRDDCGYEHELKNTKLGHDWDYVETTLPTCEGDKGYDWYECGRDNCQETKKDNEKTFTKNKKYLGREDLELTAKEEFELEHPAFAEALESGEAEYHEYREGDCLNYGYWKAECPHCDKTYLVLIDGTGMGHSFTDYVDDENATCTENGTETAVCDRCGDAEDTREIEDSALDHDFEGNYVYNNDATCEANGTETAICGRDGCEEEDTREAEDTMLEHNFEDNAVEEEDECETPGFIHYECTLGCGSEYVDGYIDEVKHVEDDPIRTNPSCTVDGSIVINCEICGDELSSEPLYATGHKNAAGETIEDKCTDTVTDRVCVNDDAENHAGCPLTANNSGKKVVAKSHAIEEITVYPGCEHYGYYAETCANGCGEKNLITNIIDPHGHWAPWGQHIMADDMTAIDVDDCGYAGEYFLYCQENDIDYDGNITAYTAPTYESLGSVSFICSYDDCGDEITRDVILTGVNFTLDIENAVAAGEAYVDSGIIAVNVKINSYLETGVWGFQFNVDYDAENLIYMGYTFNNEEFNGFHQATENCNCDDHDEYVEWHYVTVMAYVENTPEGEKQDVLVQGSDDVITLYFQLRGTNTEYRDEAWLEIDPTYTDVRNADQEALESHGDEAEVEIGVFADGNGDSWATVADVQYAYFIATGLYEDNTYDAAVDINKDGWITAADVRLLADYATGAAEYEDLFATVDWELPEGFVPVA